MAWNIRRLRVAQGVSQEQLAADAGIARSYIGELERAKKAATVDLLDKLALVLETSVSEFLRTPDEGETSPSPLPGGRRRR